MTPEPAKVLKVQANILLSDDGGNLPVNDSIETIELKFSEALDQKTTSGNVKLFRIDAAGNLVDVPVYIRIEKDKPDLMLINSNPVRKFAEGEAYQLQVGVGLKSASGAALEKDFIGYFATNASFVLSGVQTASPARTQIVVISDVHLGIDDRIAECNHNRPALVDFLNRVRVSPAIKELVIAGDIMDQWFLPMDYESPQPEAHFADLIAANNQPVIDAVNALIQAGELKVTYVPGNHDITVTEADIARIFPGINQARDEVQGLGEYVTGVNSEIVIEHSHKYNFFVAPDPISNREITQNTTSIMPPGYFFTRIATSSVMEGKPQSDNTFPEVEVDKNDESQYLTLLYYLTWKSILVSLPVSEKFSDRVMITGIDGFTEKYAINDLLPQVNPQTGKLEMVLFKGIVDTWDERQTANGVRVKIPTPQAILGAADGRFTDLQSKIQYFDVDASKRIVVFGHTHDARIVPFTNLKGQKTIYANSGTWIDHPLGFPGMTFVVITQGKPGSALTLVNLYQYSADSTVTQWGGAQAITNL